MAVKLSVNVNKVATLRNTRALDIPSVEGLARVALEAGAAGITVHPRPDQRHIRPHDVMDLAALVKQFPRREYNIEGNPFHGYMELVEKVRPTQCTLVPDSVEQATSDHGWDLRANGERLRPVIAELRRLGARVSLFMDADSPELERAKELGADRVELYTEPYAAGYLEGGPARERVIGLFTEAAKRASRAGLGVNAGHDLNLENLPALVWAVPELAEVSIGHALIGDALLFGMEGAVRRYLRACGG